MGTILYVEDEAFVREVTREILHSAGFRVLAATTAGQAAEIYEQHPLEIDLLLSDLILPGENGCQLAVRLRAKNPALRVLLVTGYQDRMAERQPVWDGCLAKPFSSAVLLSRIRQTLDQSGLVPGMETVLRPACESA